MVESIIFYVLATALLVSSMVLITRTNPIASALSLMIGFIALAGLYALMSASFVAVMQVLVYAGGIMVLIVFVIMILNLTNEELLPMKVDRFVTYSVLLIAVAGVFLPLFFVLTAGVLPLGAEPQSGFGSITEMSKLIFGKFIFPFEMLSLVLLTAIVGALVIAKRKL